MPQSRLLQARRELSFRFGYLHLIVFGSIVATGAGLHAAAFYVEHQSELDAATTVQTVAVPVGVFIATVYVLYTWLVASLDVFHILLIVLTAAVLVAAVVLAGRGMSMANALLIVMLAPAVSVIGYELLGYRHVDQAIGARLATEESGKPFS